MNNLKEIFSNIDYEILNGEIDKEITEIVYDSRKVTKGSVFFCFVGANFDAHEFIDQVIENEPAAIIVEKDIEITEKFNDITIIKVPSKKDGENYGTRFALGEASAKFFDEPAKKLKMIGITGTKGKTSTTSTIQITLNNAGIKCGTIGTVGIDDGKEHVPSKTTTPESFEIQKALVRMIENGCKACVMEVSSQALMLNRVAGIEFDYGIFTNMSIDHIGEAEHKDFDDYVHCKSLLFKMSKTGIFNKDDEQFENMTKNASCKILTYAYDNEADLKAYDFKYLREGEFIGSTFSTKGIVDDNFKISAPGKFSMYNALPVILLSKELKISNDVIKESLMQIHVKGRMEPVKISSKFHLLIDYAHNAVSTESILKAMREYDPGRIVSLFGCGGNRSKTRRYEMGEASGKYADFSIITEDNSRFEKVDDIISDILVGMKKTDGEYIVIPDRKEAIKYAIQSAKEGDIILLLGKGHEDYQEKNGERKPFDERVIIKEILDEINWQYD